MRNRPKENVPAGRDKFSFCTFVLQKCGQYNKCRIETIGGGFAQCSKLEKVVIPSSVTKIEKGEFRYSKDTVTLYVKKGSYAEKYAKKNKLRYKYSK